MGYLLKCQEGRQHCCACIRGVAQLAPRCEQRKEMVFPSNTDSFPEGCISNQALVPHGTPGCDGQPTET